MLHPGYCVHLNGEECSEAEYCCNQVNNNLFCTHLYTVLYTCTPVLNTNATSNFSSLQFFTLIISLTLSNARSSLHEKFTIDGAMLMFSNPGICYLILPSTSLCLYLILSDITMRFHSSGWLPARTWGPSWETIKIQYFRQLLHSTRLRVVHRSKFYIQVFLVR